MLTKFRREQFDALLDSIALADQIGPGGSSDSLSGPNTGRPFSVAIALNHRPFDDATSADATGAGK